QPALFAFEYALFSLLEAWGVRPAAVMGHSIGEYAAACAAGVFGMEDGLRLVAERGRLMQALPSGGAMLAVLASERDVRASLAGHAETAVAAVNAEDEIVVSGPRAAIDDLERAWGSRGVRARKLAVSHAFHSPLMEPVREALRDVLARARFAAPRL